MSTLVWFRQDLRIADNPALIAAIEARDPIIPIFIHAPAEEGPWPPGGAARWWLHHSLKELQENLAACGSRLCIRASGDSLSALRALARESGATRVVWNRRYEPAAILRDREITAALRSDGLETKSFNSALLHEPWTIRTTSGGPFQVFTPFWRHCASLADPADPLPAPQALRAPDAWPEALPLDQLSLLARLPWSHGIQAAWTPGSAAAHALLGEFLTERFDDYASRRDRPGIRGTSRLSPYLHFGEIGPREIWHATRRFALQRGQHTSWRESHFLRELGWREFAHHLLFHFPETPEQPLRARYAGFPWKSNATTLKAWQRGTTGYPIVDAGMRELWQTGWMHNRMRMVVASFLVKDLLLPWTQGARWFWDTLVDADLASNTLGWQWVAGCGADAAPFFRIFNPVSQGTKFDPDGTYVRRWVPEVSQLTDKWLHRPWEAPASELRSAGVILGSTYPQPIVEHQAARTQALGAYEQLKGAGLTMPPKQCGS
jgi:deoxyribodipyrimidine photo-lyase